MKARNQTPAPTSDASAYDELTVELERANVLAYHLADRFAELKDRHASADPVELHALSLIAEQITYKHELVLRKATEILESTVPRAIA